MRPAPSGTPVAAQSPEERTPADGSARPQTPDDAPAGEPTTVLAAAPLHLSTSTSTVRTDQIRRTRVLHVGFTRAPGLKIVVSLLATIILAYLVALLLGFPNEQLNGTEVTIILVASALVVLFVGGVYPRIVKGRD